MHSNKQHRLRFPLIGLACFLAGAFAGILHQNDQWL
jgi:hypothetical protein